MSTKLNITPGEVKQADSGLWVSAAEDVETPAVVGSKKRQVNATS